MLVPSHAKEIRCWVYVAFLFLGAGWSYESIMYLAGVCKLSRSYGIVHGQGNDTMAIIWGYMLLAFNALFDGLHPRKDPCDNDWPVGSYQASIAGKEICGGRYFGVVWCCTHDQE